MLRRNCTALLGGGVPRVHDFALGPEYYMHFGGMGEGKGWFSRTWKGGMMKEFKGLDLTGCRYTTNCT